MSRIILGGAIVSMFFSVAAVSAPYEECFLENKRGLTDASAIQEVKDVCRAKHTPKKCRKYLPQNESADISGMEREMNDTSLKGCLASCDKSGFFNKNFGGDCSVD